MLDFLKQRLLGLSFEEPAGFRAKRELCLGMREDLLLADKSIRVWLKGAEAMSNAAAKLAEISAMKDTDLLRLGTQISVEMGPERSASVCKQALESINLKVKLLAELKKNAAGLEALAYAKERLERKLAEEQDAGRRQSLAREHVAAVKAYDNAFTLLEAHFDFLLEESDGKGGLGLAKPELDIFKKSCSNVFSHCSKVCEKIYSPSSEPTDLENAWSAFNRRKEDCIEKARAKALEFQPMLIAAATAPSDADGKDPVKSLPLSPVSPTSPVPPPLPSKMAVKAPPPIPSGPSTADGDHPPPRPPPLIPESPGKVSPPIPLRPQTSASGRLPPPRPTAATPPPVPTVVVPPPVPTSIAAPLPVPTSTAVPPPVPPPAPTIEGTPSMVLPLDPTFTETSIQEELDVTSQSIAQASPLSPIVPDEGFLEEVRALFDYTPENNDELELCVDDVIMVLEKQEDGWWRGSKGDGSTGYFPSNYVEPVLDESFDGAV
mmetsp:Transcript_22403/g.41977  ORF Transcript_22403/g.41977 Transcript_22403/m.41977 type:complete len:491 (+) Transcript_22403:108-1580(+)